MRDDILDCLTDEGGSAAREHARGGKRHGGASNASRASGATSPRRTRVSTIAAPGKRDLSLDRDGRVAPSGKHRGWLLNARDRRARDYLWSSRPISPPAGRRRLIGQWMRWTRRAELRVRPAHRRLASVLSLDRRRTRARSGCAVQQRHPRPYGRRLHRGDLATWAPKVARTYTRRPGRGRGSTSTGMASRAGAQGTVRPRPHRVRPRRRRHSPAASRRRSRPCGEFDERRCQRRGVLCYYAYSPLYTGNAQRTTLLDRCAPCRT